jgi:hypothetical protein
MSLILESLDHDRFVEVISAVNDATAGLSWRMLNSPPFDMDLSNDWLNNHSLPRHMLKRLMAEYSDFYVASRLCADYCIIAYAENGHSNSRDCFVTACGASEDVKLYLDQAGPANALCINGNKRNAYPHGSAIFHLSPAWILLLSSLHG